MKLYTLENDFHNTTARTKYGPTDREDIASRGFIYEVSTAEKQAMNRAWKKLCGIKECTCCNEWGER